MNKSIFYLLFFTFLCFSLNLYSQDEISNQGAADFFATLSEQDTDLIYRYYHTWETTEDYPRGRDEIYHRLDEEDIPQQRYYYRVGLDTQNQVRVFEFYTDKGLYLYQECYDEEGRLLADYHYIRTTGEGIELSNYQLYGWSALYTPQPEPTEEEELSQNPYEYPPEKGPEQTLLVERRLYDPANQIKILELYNEQGYVEKKIFLSPQGTQEETYDEIDMNQP